MKSFLEEIEEEGRVKGREEGITTAIVIYLRRRFGDAVSGALIEKIEAINDYPALEKIFDSLFDATKLDDIERLVGEITA